jgi:hypothetical protein
VKANSDRENNKKKRKADFKFGYASRGKYFGVADEKKKIEGCNRRSTSRTILASNYYNEYLPSCWGGAMANMSSVVPVSNFYNEYLLNCWGGAMANTSNTSIAACILLYFLFKEWFYYLLVTKAASHSLVLRVICHVLLGLGPLKTSGECSMDITSCVRYI